MDATIQAMYALLPAAYQPYVLLVLIAMYIVTKWRSNQKSADSAKAISLDAKPAGFFSRIVDFIC